MMTITASFAALLFLLITLLAMNTSRWRRKSFAGMTPEVRDMVRRASRSHGNTFEHTVPVILLMMFYELHGGSATVLCTIGSVFFLARLAYAWGMLNKPASMPMVIAAAVTYLIELTLVVLVGVAVMRAAS